MIPKTIHTVWIGDDSKRPDNCIATLGYSRASWVRFTAREDADTLCACLRDALVHFGGVPRHILFDNAKTVVVDGSWALVGSANFDFRSFALNFELGAVVFDSAFAALLEERFRREAQAAARRAGGTLVFSVARMRRPFASKTSVCAEWSTV